MPRRRVGFAPFVLLAMLSGGHAAQAQSPPDTSPAEALRRFLASRGAMSTVWWTFAPDLNHLFSDRGISKPPGCPLGQFRDQPDEATAASVNVFVVDFTSDPERLCGASPNPRACIAAVDSCVAVGTSVFCDHTFLQRRETLAALAYQSSWRGLGGVPDGANARFTPLPRAALIELAHSTTAGKRRTASPLEQPATMAAHTLVRTARSTVSDLATAVSLLVPVLHEIGHIEQAFCGRGLTTNEADEDTFARLLLTGDVDWELLTGLHETLTCSTLARNELFADLRSLDMLLRYLEDEAPKAAAQPRFDFAADVDVRSRRQIQSLSRWTREVALLSLMYGLEYDVLLHQDPARGLALASSEPDDVSSPALAAHYRRAGADDVLQSVRGHLEPAFRARFLMGYLDIERLTLVNFGRTTVESHVRLAPYMTGRLRALNERSCGPDGAGKIAGLDAFVLDAILGSTHAPGIDRRGPGSLDAANQLLARFVAPDADHRALTQALQPTLDDLQAIFTQPFAERAHEHYSRLWGEGAVIQPRAGQTEVLVRAVTSDRLLWLGGSSNLPGGYRDVATQFRPGLTIYAWKFVQPGAHFGFAFDGLYYLNGRWVLVPKPYRVE